MRKQPRRIPKVHGLFFGGSLLGFVLSFFVFQSLDRPHAQLRVPASFPALKTAYEGAWRLHEVICGNKVLPSSRLPEVRFYFGGTQVVSHSHERSRRPAATNAPMCMDQRLMALRDLGKGFIKMEVLRGMSVCVDGNNRKFTIENEKDPLAGSTLTYKASDLVGNTLMLSRNVSAWESGESLCKAGDDESLVLVRD
jgi:hypothetical protein